MRNLEAGDFSDCVDQPFIRLVVLDIASGIMLREIDFQQGNVDFSHVERLLKRQFHAIRLALNAVKKHAICGLVPSLHAPLLHRIDGAFEGRREDLVPRPAHGLKPLPAPQRGAFGDHLLQFADFHLSLPPEQCKFE